MRTNNIFIIANERHIFDEYRSKGFNSILVIENKISDVCGSNIEEMNFDLSMVQQGDIIKLVSSRSYTVLYSIDSNENAIVITNKCNSNCVMCPCSVMWRQKPSIYNKNEVLDIIEMMDKSTKFLTLTGGEPTLVKTDFFDILDSISLLLPETKLMILTNGRTFSNESFFKEFLKHVPLGTRFGVPLYSADKELHDRITQSNGSWEQTISGIKKLLHFGLETEIRIVPTKMNNSCLDELCEFISSNLYGVDSVNIMAMELMGAAAKNIKDVWIDYSVSFNSIKHGILTMIYSGIDVRLYNFPLCKVDKGFWPICHKSISDYKIKYKDKCCKCSEKPNCGGVFSSTLSLSGMELTVNES